MYLNPAKTGFFNGAWRVSGIARQQDNLKYDNNGKPYNSLVVGFDSPFKYARQNFGAGLYVITDRSGNSTDNNNNIKLSQLRITGSLATEFKSGKNKIRIGIQPALVQFTADGKDYKYDGDVNPNPDYDDPNSIFSPSGNSPNRSSFKYFDLNAGALWTSRFGKFTPVIGVSLFHIVKPNYTVLSSSDKSRMPIRFVYNFGGSYKLGDKTTLYPNALFMSQSAAQDFVAGANFGYNLSDRIELIEEIYLGAQFRMPSGKNKATGKITNSDAPIIIAGVKLPRWNIGISRDIAISNIQSNFPRQVGAWEVSVIYIAPDVMLKKKMIPCDRY